jgi:hypothetical protein
MKTITHQEYLDMSFSKQNKFTGIVKYPRGTIIYFKNGRYHREDGPAVILSSNNMQYWIYGEHTTKEAVELLRDMIKLKGI